MVLVQMQIICLFVVERNESTFVSSENFEKVGDDKWMFVEKLKEVTFSSLHGLMMKLH